ncbi:protein eyes shut homolog [Ara ararauna]
MPHKAKITKVATRNTKFVYGGDKTVNHGDKHLGPFCEEPGDPCASQPCLNGGICQYNQYGYVCDCPAGFLGHSCEIDINECSSRPCQKGGTCIDLPNCLCAPGWTGEFCKFAENACLVYPNSCSDGATCIDMSQLGEQPLFQCLCPHNFTGEFCEVQIDTCGSSPCENGGTCIDYGDHFKCSCPIGFEGERCKLDIDACLFSNISCTPGALCVDKSHGFNYTCLSPCIGNAEVCANGGSCFYDEENQRSHCACALGWKGQTCLENINDCEVNQCQHGATCEDGVNEYRCICPLGYTGTFCELDGNNCIGNQCSEYGFCEDHLHNYSCICVPGYEGPFCELEINECSSSPCRNGATCMDLIDRFSCLCAAGFKAEVPKDWKKVNANPIFKKCKNKDLGNYRQVNVTLIPMKVMEQLILATMNYKKIIWSRQHGFTNA